MASAAVRVAIGEGLPQLGVTCLVIVFTTS